MQRYRTRLLGALLASTACATPGLAIAQDEPPQTVDSIVVTGQFVPDEKRATSEISSVLDAEALEITGDSDLAGSLRRVTGLSQDDGFVFVRGLNERYTQVLLNGMTFPSNDPLQRVVPLDIFPTSLIESVVVQKTFSPEYPGDFGGGVISLRTLATPQEEFFEFGISGTINTVTTFEDGLTYDGGDYDWLGADFGERRFDPIIPDTAILTEPQGSGGPNQAEREIISEAFRNSWSLDRQEITPDVGVEGSYGNSWDVGGDGGAIGFVAAFDYSMEWTTRDGIRNEPATAGGETIPNERFTPEACEQFSQNTDQPVTGCGFRSTDQQINLNGLVSVGWDIDPDNSIKYTTAVLRKTNKEAFQQIGEDEEDGEDINQRNRIDWIERQTWTQQLTGEHFIQIFPEGSDWLATQFEWFGAYSESKRDVEDRKTFTYEANPGGSGVFVFDDSNASNQIEYSALLDDTYEAGFDILQPTAFWGQPVDLKTGFQYFKQERDQTQRTFSFQPCDSLTGINVPLCPSGFSNTWLSQTGPGELRRQVPEIIFGPINVDPSGFLIEETTENSDSFSALFELYAAYGQIDAQVTDTVRLAAGVRWESSEQATLSFVRSQTACSQFGPDVIGLGGCSAGANGGVTGVLPEGTPLPSNLDEEYFLPAATATWEFLPNNQIRLAYSQTVNRPSLRELSLARFLEPDRDIVIQGNPTLDVSEFQNFDARWEWYFDRGQFFTLGVFYKDIESPIEQSFLISGEDRFRTFINADTGEMLGVEAELQIDVPMNEWLPWLGTREFFFIGNGSWIDAEVDLPDFLTTPPAGGNVSVLTSDTRTLQGQSEWLGNVQFGYEDEENIERAAILFNYTGPRIEAAGPQGIDDFVETPPVLLDFVFSKGFETWGGVTEFSFEARNLLDDDYVLEAGNVILEQYDIGRSFQFGVSIKY